MRNLLDSTLAKHTNKLVKSILVVSAFALASCGSSTPSLCDCLTKSEYSSGSNLSKCQEVFRKNYGTSDPSMAQMRNDYNNCK